MKTTRRGLFTRKSPLHRGRIGHGSRESAAKHLWPLPYGKWRGSSVRSGGREGPRVSTRNRIEASPAKRVAAQYSPHRKNGSPQHSMTGDSGQGVFRTCRLKTACARRPADGMQQGRNPAPVQVRHVSLPFSQSFQ
jgi:hypothetical protein